MRSVPSVNLGPLISRKLLELESRNFAHISMGPSTLFAVKIFRYGRAGGTASPGVNLGPPHILETTGARKSKFLHPF